MASCSLCFYAKYYFLRFDKYVSCILEKYILYYKIKAKNNENHKRHSLIDLK